MKQKKKSFLKHLASLNLAVVVILSLAVVAAVGTIYEARFDTETASALVYQSPWMYLVMGLLMINLTAVMIDRWPWKMHHTGFVLAHIGIIILLIGGLITQKLGIDGSMYFEIGTQSRLVTLNEKQISVYSTFDGNQYTDLIHKDVSFLKKSAKEEPIRIPVMDGAIEVIDSIPYAQASERVIPSENESDGSALRFQLYNSMVNEIQWMNQSRMGKMTTAEFGPLKLIFGNPGSNNLTGANTLVLIPPADLNALHQKTKIKKTTKEKPSGLTYIIYKKDSAKPFKQGILHEGEEIELPWMGFKFKSLRFYSKARREWEIKPVDRPNATTTSAILVQYKEQKQWIQLNDIVRLFTKDGAYILKYGQKQVDIGEDLFLKKFSIGHYQGTRRAMAYESVVEVPGLGEHLISMNEPLHYKGYTFYQASFQQDPKTGEPIASILSVNKDPGRWMKYIGSLIIVLGIIHLFWFRQRQKKKSE